MSGTDTDPVGIIDEPAAPALSLGEHLDELRARLIRVALAVGLAFILCFAFYQTLWDIAMLPRINAAQMLDMPADKAFPLQFLRPVEGLGEAAGLAIKCALALALPVVFIELWFFISPGLRGSERRAMLIVISGGTVLFFCGVLLAFFIAAPLGLRFLTEFNQTLEGTVQQWTVEGYMGFIAMVCLGFGACFELPLVMAALAWVGLITPAGIARYWRHAVLGIAVIGAAFTPPDPFTMLLLSGCLLALFGLGYLLAVVVSRKENPEIGAESCEEGGE